MQIETEHATTKATLKAETDPLHLCCHPLGKLEFVSDTISALCDCGKVQSAISRLRDCMSSPVIDCRELSRLIDELQCQRPAEDTDTERKLTESFQGGAK